MLFNSAVFLVFAGFFFALWPLVRPRPRLRYPALIAAAAVFYGWWDWRFLFLLFGPGVIDFYLVRAMVARPRWRRWLLGASLAMNLGSLAVFKYSGWLVDILQQGLATFGVETELRDALPGLVFLLPIGISFYTFQALTYVLEVYHDRLTPTPSLLHFLAFKSLFPLLLAGPIMPASDLLPQLAASPAPTADDRWEGTRMIVFGCFQKLVIADGLAPYVNEAFAERVPAASSAYWWVIVAAYAVQIYCDFGGYSHIAWGLGRWLGYRFILNFRHPYLATSFSEFWSRWHVSLTNWIWRYVFTPLTYALLRRLERFRLPTVEQEMRLAYPAAALIAMSLCGLWHGAGLTFIVWGALHGILLGLERLTGAPRRLRRLPRGRNLAMAGTLLAVALCWVFFRAESLAQAGAIFGRLFGGAGGMASLRGEFGGFALMNCALLLGMAVAREAWHGYDVAARLPLGPAARQRLDVLGVALLIPACLYFRGPGAEFIYFQF